MAKKKLIIDTDPGADDAMAIFMALDAHARGEVEILGFTLVQGNGSLENVLINMYRILDTANFGHLPVFLGADLPLVSGTKPFIEYQGVDGFNGVQFDSVPDVDRHVKGEQAFQAIQRLARENKGEVTLVAIGPLTNVALALKTDRALATNLKEIFIMGGNFEGEGNNSMGAEFNFLNDPEAAYVVLDRTVCPTYIAGWELCANYSRPDPDFRIKVLGSIDSPEMALLNRLEAGWFDHYIMCDQLAMAAALDERVMAVVEDHVASIELHGAHTRGQLLLDRRQWYFGEHKRRNAKIIKKLDMDKFMGLMLRAFKKEGRE